MTQKPTPTPVIPKKLSDMMPDLLGGATFACDDSHQGRLGATITSWSKPPAVDILLLEAIKLMSKIGDEHAKIEDIKNVMLIEALIELASKAVPKVMAWTCATVYDPKGSFRPGKMVIWSGHLSKAHAESWIPGWKKCLNRGGDIWQPVIKRPCHLSAIRRLGTRHEND